MPLQSAGVWHASPLGAELDAGADANEGAVRADAVAGDDGDEGAGSFEPQAQSNNKATATMAFGALTLAEYHAGGEDALLEEAK
jgi:hypothetical protein